VLRGGHIPGARSVPWKEAVNADATFKSAAELKKIYQENLGLKPDDDVIAYCRIGERSSHALVRPQLPPRLHQGTQLRRFLDRAGATASAPIEKSVSGTGPMSYPGKLEAIISLFEGLPDAEKRETLIAYADQARAQEPAEGESFDLEDVRKDEECTDTVAVFLRIDPAGGAHFARDPRSQVQTLTKAMSSILCKGLDGIKPEEVLAIPADFVPKIVGAELVRLRSQTVYYLLTRMKGIVKVWHRRKQTGSH